MVKGNISHFEWLTSRLSLILSALIDFILFQTINKFSIYHSGDNYFLILDFFIIFFWLSLSYIIGRYHHSQLKTIRILRDFLLTFIVFLGCSLLLLLYFNIYSRNLIHNIFLIRINLLIIFSLLSYICQYLLYKYIERSFKKNKTWVLIGSLELRDKILEVMNYHSKYFNIIRFERISDLKSIKLKDYSGVILEDFNIFDNNDKNELINLNQVGTKILNVCNWSQIIAQRIPIEFIETNELLAQLLRTNEVSVQLRLKRFGDILISTSLIFLSLPIIILVSIIIYISDGKNILYFQNRVGRNGKIFRICKLRSMKINAEEKGAQWSNKNDTRITRIGKFIRSTRIDELPQLISVIKGDMSLIGPRPERPEFDELLKLEIPFYESRYSIRPGLSGWAQVNFPYGSSIKDASMKLSYDLYYKKNFSFWLDLLIFIKTIKIVANREGYKALK